MSFRVNSQCTQLHVAAAADLASAVHCNQLDKSETAYILHCFEVMRMVAPEIDAMVVALLHDSLEDYEGNPMGRLHLENSIRLDFPPHIYEAIYAITHMHGEDYPQYIERVAKNYLARKVKIADLTHNLDPRRIPAAQIVDKDFRRWEKYRTALVRLTREP